MSVHEKHSLFDKFIEKEKEVNELKRQLRFTQLSINEYQAKILVLEKSSKQLKELKAELDRINSY